MFPAYDNLLPTLRRYDRTAPMLTWTGFFFSIATILVISRRNLPLAISAGAIVLGIFTLSFESLLERVIYTITDLTVIMLTLAMGLIPLIGGVMKETGQIDALVSNIRISRRFLLPLSASLMGLLPMPGGALLSAPILDRAGKGVSPALKAAINNWYRHLFILIYPLAPALIISTKICDLDIYACILYIMPICVIAAVLGYFFFLRKIDGRFKSDSEFSARGLLAPLAIVLCAPVIDFTLKRVTNIGSASTLIGVAIALLLAYVLAEKRPHLGRLTLQMKAWNFALIILGMFLYLHVFVETDLGSLIADLPLPPLMLAVSAGFLLALLTGRVQLPASIVLPVYLASAGSITPYFFTLIYVAMYFGYIISPVHPCLTVTCEFFGISIRRMMKELALPTAIIVIIVAGLTIAT